MKLRECPNCRGPFKPKHSVQKYCRPECFHESRVPGERAPGTVQSAVAPRSDHGFIRPNLDFPKGKTLRGVVCSDTHCPKERMDAVDEMIRRERGADFCIVAGDSLDMYSEASFRKFERISAKEEIAHGKTFFRKMSDSFGQTLTCDANHTDRLRKNLATRLPFDTQEWLSELVGELNPLKAVTADLPNVIMAHNDIEDGLTANWFIQVGDALFSHLEVSGGRPGDALVKAHDKFYHWSEILRLDSYRFIFQAHTHKLNLATFGGKFLVETGCLCMTQDYQVRGDSKGRPQHRGYWTLEMTDGQIDENSLRHVSLERFCLGKGR